MARGRVEKRGSKKRKVKPVILIVTEGSKTEPGYFNQYRCACGWKQNQCRRDGL